MQIQLVLADGSKVGSVFEVGGLPAPGSLVEVFLKPAGCTLYRVDDGPTRYKDTMLGSVERKALVPHVQISPVAPADPILDVSISSVEDAERQQARHDAGLEADAPAAKKGPEPAPPPVNQTTVAPAQERRRSGGRRR